MKVNLFDLMYAEKIKHIMNQSASLNQRTGKSVRAVHGACFSIPPNVFPILSLRDINPLWACAEAVWFLNGSGDARFMERFNFRIWSMFADEDKMVWSATGYRWRHHFEADQVMHLVHKLRRDPTNRQAVLLSWDPHDDNLAPGPNVPCVMIWHFHVIDGLLHMSVLQRSADMYFGLPHDILGSRLVQELIAAKLRLKPGGIMYAVSNAHLYEDQWAAAEEMMYRASEGAHNIYPAPPELLLTEAHFDAALEGNEKLPVDLLSRIQAFYNPAPAISGPKLVK